MNLLDRDREINLTPIFIVGNAGISLILLILVVILNGKMGKIASTRTPTLVELNDGTSARVAPLPHNERTSQAITNFVKEIMRGLMSWNAVRTDQSKKPEIDQGVQVGEHKVTTSASDSAYAISEDFRANFLKELGEQGKRTKIFKKLQYIFRSVRPKYFN